MIYRRRPCGRCSRATTPHPATRPLSQDDPFARQFGNVDLGAPTGSDNESIDADLAREYADNHEGP